MPGATMRPHAALGSGRLAGLLSGLGARDDRRVHPVAPLRIVVLEHRHHIVGADLLEPRLGAFFQAWGAMRDRWMGSGWGPRASRPISVSRRPREPTNGSSFRARMSRMMAIGTTARMRNVGMRRSSRRPS